jgi:hypothetical protein
LLQLNRKSNSGGDGSSFVLRTALMVDGRLMEVDGVVMGGGS